MKRIMTIVAVAVMAMATVSLTACGEKEKDRTDTTPADTTGGGQTGGGEQGGYVAGQNYFTGHSWLGTWQDLYDLHREDGGRTYVDFEITLDFLTENTGVMSQHVVVGQTYDQGTEEHPFTYTCEVGEWQQDNTFQATNVNITFTDVQDVDANGNPLQLTVAYDYTDSTLVGYYGVILTGEDGSQQEFNAHYEDYDFLVFFKQH